jgi:hypothetical protein
MALQLRLRQREKYTSWFARVGQYTVLRLPAKRRKQEKNAQEACMSNLSITDTIISKLAREIARNLYPTAEIRDQFKLTVEEFDEATNTPFFQVRLAEEVSLWNDPKNAEVRVKAKSGTLVEESLPEIYRLIHDPTQPMAAKVAALQTVARFAFDNPNIKGSSDDSDRRVKITINIDGKSLSFDKEKPKIIDGELLSLTPKVANGT